MPKKKVAKPIKKAVAKTNGAKASPGLKAKATKSSPKKPARSGPDERVPAKPTISIAAASSAASNEVSLGRPLVTQEEKLYMLFHDDYQARQVFEFLRVDNVKELEQLSPQQIVHMMSKPLRMTVDRIRQRLAQYKRSLKDDEQFAADYRKKAK